MADWVLNVSELNEYVRKRLAGDPMLRRVRVRGEISGYNPRYAGARFFTLKDDGAKLKCVIFPESLRQLDFDPENGDLVTATGQITLYTRDGSYQLIVQEMEQAGAGEQYLQLERLKRRLQAEGLFDPEHKKTLPMCPRTIGIVTSESGDAIWDIIRTARENNPSVGILICDSRVQGESAAETIASGIRALNENGRPDVILVGRGGGSAEELMGYNDESVARAIYESAIPVISCVGHTLNSTIADMAADVQAITPTQAAALAVRPRAELEERLNALMRRADHCLDARRQLARSRLDVAKASFALSDPRRAVITERREALRKLMGSYALAMPRRLLIEDRRAALERLGRSAVFQRPQQVLTESRRAELANVMRRSQLQNPQATVSRSRAELSALYDRFRRAYDARKRQRALELSLWKEKLSALNPYGVLKRGYAAVLSDETVVESVCDVRKGQALRVLLADGSFGAVVTDVKEERDPLKGTMKE